MSHDTLCPVGLDVSKRTLDVAVVWHGKRHSTQVGNTQVGLEHLQVWLSQHGVHRAHVCLEATGTYSDAVALFCHEQGHQVSVLNPARVAAFRRSEGKLSKTDAQDAALLLRYGEQKHPAAWTPMSQETQQLQALVQRLEDLEQMRQQERNRLENTRWSQPVREQIEANIERLSEQMEQIKQWIEEQSQTPTEQIKQQVEHLQSIVGIGALSAARIVGLLGELSRFHTVEQVVSFAGLDPCEQQSGTSVRGPSRISKQGSALLRKCLYMCALVSQRWDADMKQWAEQLKARGKATKQVLVAVMRKLLHIIYGVCKSGCDYDPRLAFPSHYPPEREGLASGG